MTELLTAAQMRAIEKAAIDSGEVTGLELMERAGRGVVETVFEEWPELAKTSHKAVVLCGPGNNGGDGFVVARLLKELGWEVEVFLYGDAGKLPPDARANYERWGEMGHIEDMNFETVCDAGPFDLRVDAVFGTGLKRPAPKVVHSAFKASWSCQGPSRKPLVKRVAIDCPSCIDLDSGNLLGFQNEWKGDVIQDFHSNLTVTFHSPKAGHYLAGGPVYRCNLIVCDIGLNEHAGEVLFPAQIVKLVGDVRYDAWKVSRNHKYSHGHALILSGPSGKGGAARLAARGALRIGAGVVTVGCPPEAVVENASQLNAIMLTAVHDADALARVLQDTRINALCLGPALGKGARERELVRVALETKRPMVLDADALSLLQIDEADGLFGLLHEGCVLTPHAGEFARMFPDIAKKLNAPAITGPAYSKVDATREAAKRAGCVVLFKGADTVIADADGRCAINSAHYERAAPWLATAGSGDVLAGFITGLLARGFAPMQAAETAAWLHVECARSFGPGLIAEDLPEALPSVFKSLGI